MPETNGVCSLGQSGSMSEEASVPKPSTRKMSSKTSSQPSSLQDPGVTRKAQRSLTSKNQPIPNNTHRWSRERESSQTPLAQRRPDRRSRAESPGMKQSAQEVSASRSEHLPASGVKRDPGRRHRAAGRPSTAAEARRSPGRSPAQLRDQRPLSSRRWKDLLTTTSQDPEALKRSRSHIYTNTERTLPTKNCSRCENNRLGNKFATNLITDSSQNHQYLSVLVHVNKNLPREKDAKDMRMRSLGCGGAPRRQAPRCPPLRSEEAVKTTVGHRHPSDGHPVSQQLGAPASCDSGKGQTHFSSRGLFLPGQGTNVHTPRCVSRCERLETVVCPRQQSPRRQPRGVLLDCEKVSQKKSHRVSR